MDYTRNPTKDFYIDAYWLLKTALEKILSNPTESQTISREVLSKLQVTRVKKN